MRALDAVRLRDVAAVCVLDLASGASAKWRATDDIYPASVIKVAMMSEAFRRFADGSLSPSDRVRVTKANMTSTAEETPLKPGYEARLDELIDLMIARSDNIATNQLIDILRRERVTSSMRDLGIPGFMLGRKLSGAEPLVDDPEWGERNSLRPDAAAKLLQLIATGRVPGAAAQYAILGRCVDNTKLAAGLELGDRFMHKTGETSAVNHDAGILQTNAGREYVIVMYTERAVDSRLARWMRQLRPHL